MTERYTIKDINGSVKARLTGSHIQCRVISDALTQITVYDGNDTNGIITISEFILTVEHDISTDV